MLDRNLDRRLLALCHALGRIVCEEARVVRLGADERVVVLPRVEEVDGAARRRGWRVAQQPQRLARSDDHLDRVVPRDDDDLRLASPMPVAARARPAQRG
eukprot:3088892-Prymnesium_polylepis.1